jgi:alkaline phosphatase D
MSEIDRRAFLRAALAAGSGAALGEAGCSPSPAPPAPPPVSTIPALGPRELPSSAPAAVPSEAARPVLTHGVQTGDVTESRAVVWARSDRLARMVVEWDTDPSFGNPRRVEGEVATEESDFTTRVDLAELPAGRPVHYRVVFEDPGSPRARSAPALGSFRTALGPADRSDQMFAWSGDTCGQGWGINLEWGGMKSYETVRAARPDFFLHCGDLIYGDYPIPPEIKLPDGTVWKNVTTEAKSHVAETLADFRGNFAYNLLDENVRRMNAEVPQVVMWDDHEVHNNWFPGETLEDKRYTERSCRVLMRRSRRAMGEYTPMRVVDGDPELVYRSFSRGPHLDVFVLDERSYRNDNGGNQEATMVPMLGQAQLAWLKQGLAASKATWKVIASDQPLALRVYETRHGGPWEDAWANGKGPPAGRELELADLLSFAKKKRIRNLVFLTADVHYACATRFDPKKGEFHDFDPFWEFIAGPMHASTYGPNPLDPTFGPVVEYQSPPSGRNLRGPKDGGQYFGTVKIEGQSGVMTVALWDLLGNKLHSVDLPPQR